MNERIRPTPDEHREHLLVGMTVCLVCGSDSLGQMTDYHGQSKCANCGTTLQQMGSHFEDEFLVELGITKDQVARKYCDCFDVVPILRDYWRETSRKIPFGCYLTESPIPKGDYEFFSDWLAANKYRYAVEYPEMFDLNVLSNHTHVVSASTSTEASTP
jgi:hypothetical protein